jgi:hypothetical protein
MPCSATQSNTIYKHKQASQAFEAWCNSQTYTKPQAPYYARLRQHNMLAALWPRRFNNTQQHYIPEAPPAEALHMTHF